MTISKNSENFIIATGKSLFLRNVIRYAFNLKNLNYKKHINIFKEKYKKNELKRCQQILIK